MRKFLCKLQILSLLLFFSCQKESIENSSVLSKVHTFRTTSGNLKRSAIFLNTISLRTITQGIGRPPLRLLHFDSEVITSNNDIGEINKNYPQNSYVINDKGNILKELAPNELVGLESEIMSEELLKGVIVNYRKKVTNKLEITNPDHKTGIITLPKQIEDDDYIMEIEINKSIYKFEFSIKNGKIENVDAPNLLVNKNGTIRNFYYPVDFYLDNEIYEYLGFKGDNTPIVKGSVRVNYSDNSNGGSVILMFRKPGKTKYKNITLRTFEGINPKGIDCKSWGTSCFYIAGLRGIDKKDIKRFVIRPLFEKEDIVGIEITYEKNDTPRGNLQIVR